MMGMGVKRLEPEMGTRSLFQISLFSLVSCLFLLFTVVSGGPLLPQKDSTEVNSSRPSKQYLKVVCGQFCSGIFRKCPYLDEHFYVRCLDLEKWCDCPPEESKDFSQFNTYYYSNNDSRRNLYAERNKIIYVVLILAFAIFAAKAYCSLDQNRESSTGGASSDNNSGNNNNNFYRGYWNWEAFERRECETNDAMAGSTQSEPSAPTVPNSNASSASTSVISMEGVGVTGPGSDLPPEYLPPPPYSECVDVKKP